MVGQIAWKSATVGLIGKLFIYDQRGLFRLDFPEKQAQFTPQHARLESLILRGATWQPETGMISIPARFLEEGPNAVDGFDLEFLQMLMRRNLLELQNETLT